MLAGAVDQPRQRVLFLEDIHRDLTWSCFHLPVSGALLGPWMAAKFQELLCIGLQILKNRPDPADESRPVTETGPEGTGSVGCQTASSAAKASSTIAALASTARLSNTSISSQNYLWPLHLSTQR